MQKPFLSFAVSFLIYFLLLGFFAFVLFKKSTMPQIALEVDADLVCDESAHEKSKTKKEQKTDLEKIAQQKKDIKKSDEEKIEPDEAKRGEESSQHKKKSTKEIPPVFQPLPQIPDDLRYEAFHSKTVARFYVNASGEVERVELIKPSQNPKLNQLLLKSLKKWKFEPTSNAHTQDIAVTFKVE